MSLKIRLALIRQNYTDAKTPGLLQYDLEVFSGDSLELIDNEIRDGSIVSIDLDQIGARDEELLSISAVSRRGRFVAAKAQSFDGSGRTGYNVALGSPTAGDQWYFADGEKGEGITETFVLFNPTDEPVDVDLLVLPTVQPIDSYLASYTVTVDPLGSVIVDPLVAFPGLADGRYAAVVSTLSKESIVASSEEVTPGKPVKISAT